MPESRTLAQVVENGIARAIVDLIVKRQQATFAAASATDSIPIDCCVTDANTLEAVVTNEARVGG